MANLAFDAAITALRQSPALARLLRSLELAEGFRFHILVGVTPLTARALRFLVEQQTKRAAVVLDPYSGLDVVNRVLQSPTAGAAVWGGFLHRLRSPRHTPFFLDGARAAPEDEPVWRELFRRLNERRNAIARELPGPLILMAPEWLTSVFSQEAPDLWSIRSSELSLPAVPISLSLNEDLPRQERSSPAGDAKLDELERLERAVAEARERLAADPENPRLQNALVVELKRLVALLTLRGQRERALQYLKEVVDISEHLAAADPHRADYRKELSTSYDQLGYLLAQLGDVQRALSLWSQSLEIDESIGNPQGKAVTLGNMAGVIAQQGDVQRALALWNQSLEIAESIGDMKGKAATLANMAGVVAQQGDLQRALTLWNQSLEILESIGDVKGKAAPLNNMAGVIARQGDVQRALALWNQSLEITESIGDMKGKAATLANMAGVIAQQGDVQRALALWNQSLEILESIGDVKGKANTLANMAWLAGQEGDAERQYSLTLEAARALASVEAWLDLTTVLGNLGISESPGTAGFLAQGFWLVSRVGVSIDDVLWVGSSLVEKIGPDHSASLTVAGATYLLIQMRSEGHPEAETILQKAGGLLGACAEARQIPEERFGSWFQEEVLSDPSTFFSRLDRALEEIVGEQEWLFDRERFPPREAGPRPPSQV